MPSANDWSERYQTAEDRSRRQTVCAKRSWRKEGDESDPYCSQWTIAHQNDPASSNLVSDWILGETDHRWIAHPECGNKTYGWNVPPSCRNDSFESHSIREVHHDHKACTRHDHVHENNDCGKDSQRLWIDWSIVTVIFNHYQEIVLTNQN